MNKIIWCCWLQGRRNAPDVVKRCFASWTTKNPGWDFRCLDANTVDLYLDIKGVVDLHKQKITPASFSDIIRLLLLKEYGGVWVDATLYCNLPLDEWLPSVLGSGFFAFSAPAPDRLISSWFLVASSGNLLIEKWAAISTLYWADRTEADEYFWVHRCFALLCESDPAAMEMWLATPRISADGPHALQALGRMYQRSGQVSEGIDWETPVFKLTYRIDLFYYRAGFLLYDLLQGVNIESEPLSLPSATGSRVINYAELSVDTENIGDHIQILAARLLLTRFKIHSNLRIDRDHEIASCRTLSEQAGPVGIVLNGWYKNNPSEWPPHSNLSPVYLGFHIRLHRAPSLLSSEALEHYHKHGPIGCRDDYTRELLASHGVDAFLSNCPSLLFPRRSCLPETQAEIFVVSRDDRIRHYLPTDLGPYTFISHYSGSTNFDSNINRAEQLLNIYKSRAKLIITTLLHCALPAIAMGIPVVVIYPLNDPAQHLSDVERFSTLLGMVPVHCHDDLTQVDWNGYGCDVSAAKLGLLDAFQRLGTKWRLPDRMMLGPFAPPDSLHIPDQQQAWEQFVLNPARTHLLMRDQQSDKVRWGNSMSYKASWADRTRQAAMLIPDGATVLEIGVGTGELKRLLRDRCDYSGADLVPLEDDVQALDLDCDQLPAEFSEYIVLLGVFCYLHHAEEAVEKVCRSAGRIICSYCLVLGQPLTGGNVERRRQRGWLNDFSKSEFVSLFEKYGHALTSCKTINSNEDFEELLMEFARSAVDLPAVWEDSRTVS